MARVIEFEGRRIQVPDDASDADIQQILTAPAAPKASPTATQASAPAAERGWLDALADTTAMRTATRFAREFNRGVADLAGLPVDAVNNAPRLFGFGPISERPFLGGEFNDSALRLFGAIPEPAEPRSGTERVAGRIGREIGATAIPVGGLIARGAQVGVPAARAAVGNAKNVLQRLYAQGLETAAVAPRQLAQREGAAAIAAGTGAGIANETAGNPQFGDNFGTDFGGSLAGVAAYSLGKGTMGAAGNALGTLFGRPEIMDDVVQESVAQTLMNNSTKLGEQAATLPPNQKVDTSALVEALRTPSAAETAIPGFQANIADRSRDAGLSNFTFNQDALLPGAASARRTNNELAVASRMEGLAPSGNAGEFRTSLETARAGRIADATNKTETARTAFEQARDLVQAVMADASARGSSLRSALADRYEQAQGAVREMFQPLNEANVPVDVAPLAERFGAVTDSLPFNDRQRFLPAEAGVPKQLVEPAVPPSASAILGPDGNPVVRPGVPATGEQPLKEVMSIRSGLTDDIRAANAAPGQSNRARIAGQFRDATDQFIDESVPADLRQQYDTARAARRDVADRFERPGTATAEVLRTREGGGYQLDDSAVASRFTPTDQGRVSDFKALMKEAGTDQRARDAITDEILTQANQQGVIEKPERLAKFMADRSIVLSEFPELSAKLQQAGVSRTELAAAERAEKELTRKLTQPGQSPVANYLQYGDERTVDAVRTVLKSAKPSEAARELVTMAGGDARAMSNARTAFWEAVKDTGMNSASGSTGNRVWNGRRLRDFISNPANEAVARELYKDAPEELDDIKRVFSALADADGSVRARAAGSSGTAQALNGGFDPALSSSSVASRLRSVNRGQLSPTIAGIDLAATWLRRRSAQMQSRAIDTLASAVVNNPGMAADLLEKYNPATYAAKRRMLLQKYGVRATQVINILDEAHDPDADMKDAINRESKTAP